MIVVDTCTVIWDALSPKALSSKAKIAIEKACEGKGIYFPEIILWKIAMLIQKGRLDPGTDYKTFIHHILNSRPYGMVGLNPDIAQAAVTLPSNFNNDPVDRIIVATAIFYKASLVTKDENLRAANCLNTIW